MYSPQDVERKEKDSNKALHDVYYMMPHKHRYGWTIVAVEHNTCT